MRIGDWVNRQRHNRGYGVQSPSSFFFVTQVLKERLPYYSYPKIEEIAEAYGCSAQRLKELFRITNHHTPANCIAAGSAAAAFAMAMARPSAEKYSITDVAPDRQESLMLKECGCLILHGNSVEILEQTLKRTKELGMLYIGDCTNRAELLETAMRYTNSNSIIVIDGIHRDEATREWWRSLVEKPQTVITYDLYSTGILLFNNERIKQHYTLLKR